MQKMMDEVSDELLVYDPKPPCKFPIFNEGETVGEVFIEEETLTVKKGK